ncbi:unnamed protein product [Caenorhabditis nigoni]
MENIFSRIIADKDAFFKNQQRDEEELTDKQKLKILEELSASKLPIFLDRYQNYLEPVDCDIFADNDDCVVQEIMKRIRQRSGISEKQKRNLRYNAMQTLLKAGDYFSDTKMREREPYLFDAMIGKFLSEEHMEFLRPTVTRDASESSWSSYMVRFEETSEIAERRKLQAKEWEGPRQEDGGKDHISRFMNHVASHEFVPEEEDDEPVEDEVEKMREKMERLAQEVEQYNDIGEDDTKEVLRHEFESFMKEKFLAGKDKEFYDYSECEQGRLPDPIRDQDDEDRWFDED